MNIPLLKKVQKAILAEPKKFDMREWFYEDDRSPCGTTACIGGHAVALATGAVSLKIAHQTLKSTEIRPRIVLDLEFSEADRLFYKATWPETFRVKYNMARSANGRAMVAAKRISHFIKTEGRE